MPASNDGQALGQETGAKSVGLIRYASIMALALALSGCDREYILEGERFDIRAPFSETAGQEPANRAAPLSLPAAVAHSEWTHRLGTPNHRISHPALGGTLQHAWSAPIGAGEDRRHRITAEPVAAQGRVFTLDSRATVTATGSNGQTVWQRDLTPAGQRGDGASGGGLALSGGVLYVTSAYGRLHALDAATGEVRWTHRFDAPAKGAPTVIGERVYVVAADSSAWVLDTRDGKVDWQLPGTPSAASMVGGAAPATAGDLVLFPIPSGELIAARRDTGMEVWRRVIAGQRQGMAYAGVTDITGDPVVVGDTIYVGNQSGRVMAMNQRDGAIRWTADEAAYGAVWPVGDALFMLSDRNRIIRLDADSGQRVWAQDLPLFTQARERRRAEIFGHYGPVLAGGRLIVASNDGMLRFFDPVSGEATGNLELPSGAAAAPIIVDRTLYVVTGDGQLHAYR
ncbi:PQQ-binding-like beta-propeller repeat protein [Rhabdonatronobacter sediminivivens]|nr:PQQ-binding-like beta-propeller repeat protein [Rhabdonatronobacter sediminivivens]